MTSARNEPMKITYISYAPVPSYAAESLQIMKVCEAMAEEGHDIRLITPIRKTDAELQGVDAAQLYGLRRDIRPECHILPPSYLGRIWYAIRGRLSSFGRIAYTRYGACAAVCVYTGARTTLELHEVPRLNSLSELILRLLLRTKSQRLRIVVITEVIRKMLADRYPFVETENIVVAPDGVDPARFANLPSRGRARQILNLPPDAAIVGHIGSLSPTNGVEVIAKLVSRMSDIHFLLVGSSGRGNALNHVRDAALCSGTIDNLTTPGHVTNSEVPLWMSACDVLLLANQIVPGWDNRNALWTSPLKMFEYMASGRPIIASDQPVLREVLDENTAVLVQSDDIDAWMGAITDLIKHPNRGRAIGAAARQKVIDRYTWRARVCTILDGLEHED